MAQNIDNQVFEAQVFPSETVQPMHLGKHSAQEMEETEGVFANTVRGFMGAVISDTEVEIFVLDRYTQKMLPFDLWFKWQHLTFIFFEKI